MNDIINGTRFNLNCISFESSEWLENLIANTCEGTPFKVTMFYVEYKPSIREGVMTLFNEGGCYNV